MALFHTFFTLFPSGLSLKNQAFSQESKRECKEKTKPFCTFVVARLSSSNCCSNILLFVWVAERLAPPPPPHQSGNTTTGKHKDEQICGICLCVSAAQHINFISPQNTENGDPKIRNRDGPGNSGKFRFSVEFPQKPSVRVIPGNPFWGPHFQRFGEIFWGK